MTDKRKPLQTRYIGAKYTVHTTADVDPKPHVPYLWQRYAPTGERELCCQIWCHAIEHAALRNLAVQSLPLIAGRAISVGTIKTLITMTRHQLGKAPTLTPIHRYHAWDKALT